MPAFPTLPDFDPAIPLSATELDILVEAIEWLRAVPAVVAVTSVTQTVPDGAVGEVITFGGDVLNNDNMWANSPDPERVTFHTAGKYLVTARANWQPGAGGVRSIELWLNDTDRIANDTDPPLGGSTEVGHNCGVLRHFAEDDYITVVPFQDSGGDLGVDCAIEAVWQSS